MNDNDDSKKSRRLTFIAVFGAVLMLYGVASAYYEYSRLKPLYDAGWDVDPPRYPALVFLAGLVLMLYTAFSVAGCFFRRLRRKSRGSSTTI